MLFFQEWGQGDPLIALHPLALESTAFAGVAEVLAERGLRTLGVDLPGFGKTPAPADLDLTPAALAEPVIELARGLERKPLLMGMSLGGRVALEAALTDPGAFRGVVLVAPYLPWRTNRWALSYGHYMKPEYAERIRLEKIWPLLKVMAGFLERQPRFEDDWLARACVRVTYYLSCPATRAAFFSAARGLALDPAFGPGGFWTRIHELRLPTAFLWAGQDRLIPASHAEHVSEELPRAHQLAIPCSGHFVQGRHFHCFEQAVALGVDHVLEDVLRVDEGRRRRRPVRFDAACLVEERRTGDSQAAAGL